MIRGKRKSFVLRRDRNIIFADGDRAGRSDRRKRTFDKNLRGKRRGGRCQLNEGRLHLNV